MVNKHAGRKRCSKQQQDWGLRGFSSVTRWNKLTWVQHTNCDTMGMIYLKNLKNVYLQKPGLYIYRLKNKHTLYLIKGNWDTSTHLLININLKSQTLSNNCTWALTHITTITSGYLFSSIHTLCIVVMLLSWVKVAANKTIYHIESTTSALGKPHPILTSE